MRICLPTEGRGGLAARVHDHFGSAPCFTIVDTEQVEVISIDHDHRNAGACTSAKEIAARGVDAVVCGGMGRRALEALSGIKVYLKEGGTVQEALEDISANRLPLLSAEEACAGGRGGCHD